MSIIISRNPSLKVILRIWLFSTEINFQILIKKGFKYNNFRVKNNTNKINDKENIIQNRYKISGKIGQGSHSHVYKAVDLKDKNNSM